MKFTGGLCFDSGGLVLAADLTYSDYSQTEYNDLRISSGDEPGRDLLEGDFSWSLGAAYTLPGSNISLRAGYSYQPLKIKGIDEISYIIDTPEVWRVDTDYGLADVDDERQFLTFGAGSIIDEALALDLGIVLGRFERKTTWLTEKREFVEVVLSGAYRF